MLRAVIFAALATGTIVACSDDAEHHLIPDGPPPDGPPQVGSGSGSDEMATLDTPHDRNLDLVVIGSSLAVATGPLLALLGRRRRRDVTPEL